MLSARFPILKGWLPGPIAIQNQHSIKVG